MLKFLTPGECLRGSDEAMQELKKVAMENRYLIKTCLNVTISEKFTPIAIAQKLLAKIDLKLDYVGRLGNRENRQCVYQFVSPNDVRDLIFRQWLNRDEVSQQESVSVNNNIDIITPVTDTTSHNCDLVSVNNNIELQTHVTDTHDVPQTLTQAWKGLKLRLQQGLESVGQFYQELVAKVGEAVGVADSEPYWNACVGQWQVWVNFEDGCKSVMCDWLVGSDSRV
ncbi:hypothetical protein VB735_18160 [Halotia wernerae UHCC 0503]|nr:hypothetical protein [Halotia wernerae UHCC 0503]